MYKKSLKSLLLLISLTIILALTACGQSQSTQQESTEEDTAGEQQEEQAKKVIVGTDAAYPPFENIESGELVGFDMELVEAILTKAGYEFEIQHVGWEPLFHNLQNGSVDLGISAITITEDREKTYDFSHPYFEANQMILVPEDSDVQKFEDLKDKIVGVQNGTTGDFKTQELKGEKNPDIKKYETTPLAIMAMNHGEVEAVVADNAVVQYYIAHNPEDKVVALEDPDSFVSEFYGLMMAKGNDQLREDVNNALNALLDDGTYSEIYKKWFGEEPDIERLKAQQ